MEFKGSAILPLHRGKTPKWLFSRMVSLTECIVNIMTDEYGLKGFLDRISDPWFFQSLSCVLGYDWHSSGTTTVTCGALKVALDKEGNGVTMCGGKGRTSLKTPQEIMEMGSIFGLKSYKIDELVYSSRMSAKVDNSLIQDGYNLYHHAFFFTENGDWTVIQQGINEQVGNARRYHWTDKHQNVIIEPQKSILCNNKLERVLDMTSIVSEENRKTCIDIVRDKPIKIKKILVKPVHKGQKRLEEWIKTRKVLVMPRSINWSAIRKAYEFQPRNYEEFVSLKGIGPRTIRGLALIAELVYGDKASWNDPVKFNFAFGGKDGVPFPVEKKSMDKAVEVLRNGIKASNIEKKDQLQAIKRLRKCIPPFNPELIKAFSNTQDQHYLLRK
jgi:hypothetical protein